MEYQITNPKYLNKTTVMARLLINPGTPQAWEIQLKPGLNSLGRSAANDFLIEHASVSSAHCQIVINGEAASIRDLGSTNGTFVNRAAIQETVLQPGQTLHLGAVEMLFNVDPPARAPMRVALTIARTHEEPPAGPPLAVALDVAEAPVMDSVLHYCKFHPRTPARLFCRKCNKYFCDLCVASRPVGGETHRFCRACSSECISLAVDITKTVPVYRSFVQQIPAAFVYPFKGIGPFFLILLSLVLPGLEFIAAFNWYGRGAVAFAYGFMYACLQYFILCTAQGDEKPAWPEFTSEELFSPLLRFFFMNLLIAGPALVLLVLTFFGHEWAAPWIIPALVLAGLYFPMAVLAVAMYDSLTALNPVLIIPSILKVPLAYLLTLVLLGVAVVLKWGGTIVLNLALPVPVLPGIFATFLSLYLLVVEVRILGLLYLCNKDRLGWFN